MVFLAFAIGFYSYVIFFLGLLHLLYQHIIVTVSIVYILGCLLVYQRKGRQKFSLQFRLLEKLLIGVLVLLSLVNLIGALGPELAFDALWYHLTLSKLYLQQHAVVFIPGGLLYYSAMPKLTEMVYIPALLVNGAIAAKLVHFGFGILSLIALYKLARIFFNKTISLITVIIFASNLVFAWESITAYIDLCRTFYELIALYCFVLWRKQQKQRWFFLAALLIGFAVTTKLLALGSLVIFLLLILITEKSWGKKIQRCLLFFIVSLLVPLPWFLFSFFHTGNPVYPFFTPIYPIGAEGNFVSPTRVFMDLWNIFTASADPLSPLYIIFLPLVIISFRKYPALFKIIAIYSLFALIIWYITPRTGGGRFILPYLPALSLLVASVIQQKQWGRVGILLVILVASITILYRGVANTKYLPVIMGKQTEADFLTNNLNFAFGDFYDTDGYLAKTIKKEETVLLIGFHNLYYVNVPFIHESYVKPTDKIAYVAIQNADLPEKYKRAKKVYENKKTHVQLYKL